MSGNLPKADQRLISSPPIKLCVFNEYPIFVAKGNSIGNEERLRHTEIDTQSAEHVRISASITSSWKGFSGNTFESYLGTAPRKSSL